MQIPDINELVDRVQVELSKHGWYQQYRFFDWKQPLSAMGMDFNPRFKYLVEFFSQCKPEDLRTVVIENYAVSPFPEPNYRLPYDGVEFKIREKLGIDLDRSKWNGVLVIPLYLTNAHERTSYHRELWEPFIAYTIDVISRLQDIKWMLSGKKAWEWENYIHPEHDVFKHYSPIVQKAPGTGHLFRMIDHLSSLNRYDRDGQTTSNKSPNT